MAYRKKCLKLVIYFFLYIVFCFLYRFLVAGKNINNQSSEIINFTVNTTGYLTYIHTATFYTVFFSVILAEGLIRPSSQNLIRVSRSQLFTINTLIAVICAAAYSVCFSLPHLIFMRIYFPASELAKISFYWLWLLQLLAYTLYYTITGLLMLTIYYILLNRILSQLVTIGLNVIMMFGYRILTLKTPIEATLVFTKHFWQGFPKQMILVQLSLLGLPLICLTLSAFVVLRRRDIL